MSELQLRMIRRNLDGLPDGTVPEGYAVRSYQHGDEKAWCAIMDTGIGSEWTVERCQQQLTTLDQFRADGLFFVTSNGEPVGSACAWPDATGDFSQAQVHMVCVRPEHRNKHLGHLLTLAVLRYLKDKGFRSAYLSTDDFRIPAIRAYLRLGFEPDFVEESHRLRWMQIFARLDQTTARWRQVRPEPLSYAVQECTGNLAILVVLDSSRQERFNRARRSVVAALNHYGLPYRILDLATAREPSQAITSHQAILFAQEDLGDSISGALARQIARAVASGVGFISFDHRIDHYPEAIRALALATPDGATHETDGIVVPSADQFIVQRRRTERLHHLRRRIDLVCVVNTGAARILLETEEQMPAALNGTIGNSRVVQFLVSPRLWDQDCFGHGEGLDDVFWRSIVWAARKPLLMKAMPALVSLRVSNATGAADGFEWLRTSVERGWTPHLGLHTDKVHPSEWQVLSSLAQSGKILCFPETLTDQDGLFFDHPAGYPYPEEALQSGIERVEARLAEHNVPLAQSFSPFQGEYGRNTLALLKDRGIRYSLTPFLPDEARKDSHLNWEPAPYGNPGFVLDYLPGHRDLFVTVAGALAFDRTDEMEKRNYHLTSGPVEEFLEPTLRASRTISIVDKIIRVVRSGLDARFYGTIALEERDIVELTGEEWETVLAHLDQATREYNGVKMSQDSISAYARSKVDTCLTHAGYDPTEKILRVVLAGTAAVPMQLQLFNDEGHEHTVTVDAFEGRKEGTFRYD